MPRDAKGHRWRFFRAGGFDQVRLDTGEDLLSLPDLDQKLWVALSCPVHGLEFDEKTLEIIDTDKDGRIRVPEVLAAVSWAGSVLKNPDSLLKREAVLPLSAIDAGTEEGKRLLSSAKEILKNLGKGDQKQITLEDTADTAKIFAATRFNGDGVVPPTSAGDPVIAKVIEDILACVGAVKDRGGADGVSQEKVDLFFKEARAFSDWWAAAEADAANVLPLGERTQGAADAFRAVKSKIDDYFARTRLVAFDPRSEGALNRNQDEYIALAIQELSASAAEVASFPLAKIEAGKPLPLKKGLNPAWTAAMAKLDSDVIQPIFGDEEAITEAEWRELSASFVAFEAWRAKKAGLLVEKLGHDRVREILDTEAKAQIDALIVEDKALEAEANAIDAVDRLIRYHRDLDALLNNFVTFKDFYSRKKKALFQAGTLYLDARSFELCIRILDPAAHATLSAKSGTYLAYVDCTRKPAPGAAGTPAPAPEKMHIVAAVTGGDAEELAIGRNGIFYDRKGNDWDATVIKLIQNPISTREAFWLPYKRVAKLISDQVEKFASSRDKEMQDKAAANISDTAKAADAPAAPPPVAPPPVAAAPDKPIDIGALAGISIAVGAIGTALTAVATGFLRLEWWQMPLALVGVMLAISGPSVLLAWLKLHRRNIGPLLDANGWAVNVHAKLNIPFGESLTALATLPPNAERSLDDPYAEPKPKWKRYVLLAAAALAVGAAWHFGLFEKAFEKYEALRRTPPPAAAPTAHPSAAPSASAK